MAAIYRTLLDEIERDGFRVLDRRIALTPLRKVWIAWKTSLRALHVNVTEPMRVAVIGGGYAGFAAAVTLADSGARGHGVRSGADAGRPRAPRRSLRGRRRQWRSTCCSARIPSYARAAAHRARPGRRARSARSAAAAPGRARRVPPGRAAAARALASRAWRCCARGPHLARAPRDARVRPPTASATGFAVRRHDGRRASRWTAAGVDTKSVGAAVPRRAQHAAGSRVGADLPQRARGRVRPQGARFGHADAAGRPVDAVPRCGSRLRRRPRRLDPQGYDRDAASHHAATTSSLRSGYTDESFAAAVVAVGPHQLDASARRRDRIAGGRTRGRVCRRSSPTSRSSPRI